MKRLIRGNVHSHIGLVGLCFLRCIGVLGEEGMIFYYNAGLLV